MKSKLRILFILRKRNESWGNEDGYSSCGKFSSGLYNSARLVKDMLVKNKIEASLVEVIDANFIDREVKKYNPTHVILEAITFIPEKLPVLVKLYPKIKWIIRNHSEVPFLSMEGNGIDWLLKYVKTKNVYISNNSENIQDDLIRLVEKSAGLSHKQAKEKVVYLPNYYYPKNDYQNILINKYIINIGCFGSIRPLKNQLIQAVAAIKFAEEKGKILNFHINGSRVEGRGDAIIKNIRLLFSHFPKHKLIEHSWLCHDDFLGLLKSMDIVMQVSFSETFNIVAADAVSVGIPVVASPEIKWVSSYCQANPTNTNDIIKKLHLVYQNQFLVFLNKFWLKRNAGKSEDIWLKYLKNS